MFTKIQNLCTVLIWPEYSKFCGFDATAKKDCKTRFVKVRFWGICCKEPKGLFLHKFNYNR